MDVDDFFLDRITTFMVKEPLLFLSSLFSMFLTLALGDPVWLCGSSELKILWKRALTD